MIDNVMNPETLTHEVPLEVLHESFKAFAATTWRGPGIVASDPYSGFSLCHYNGDALEHWQRCRRSLERFCGVTPERLIVPRQTHSATVLTLSGKDFDEGEMAVATESLECVDAVVTDIRNLVIGVNTADCLPLILLDEEAGVAGAVHAGWRGAVTGIAVNALQSMERLGAVPLRIKAIMAPCIVVDEFEVGEEVAARFPQECVARNYGYRPHIDLPLAVAMQLRGCGVTDIKFPPAGTLSNCTRYFSARAAGIASGRNFTFVFLR